jgi:hypothetical protein
LPNDLLRALDFVTDVNPAGAHRTSVKSPATGTFAIEAGGGGVAAPTWAVGPGIQGVGIGDKMTQGQPTGELALRVYVDRKRPLADLEDPVPEAVAMTNGVDVTTDVVEIGAVHVELFTQRVRPVMPGCGIGHPDVTVGTLGAFARRTGDDELYFLSNAHVIADHGLADVGDPILQPAVADKGTAADRIGALVESVPFVYSTKGFPNLVDAALGRIDSQLAQPAMRVIGRAPSGVTTNVRRGMRVHKVGRTTDLTAGVVEDVHLRLAMNYKVSPTATKRVGFRDQVLCSRFTQPGDSGALVLSSSNRAVGLHFAGSDSKSIFNRIRNVLDALRIELVLEP